MKKLNIEMTVRRMEAQNILTTSATPDIQMGDEAYTGEGCAATRTATPVAPGSFRN